MNRMSDQAEKICLVCSSGGHLAQLYRLQPVWKQYDRLWVTFDKEDANTLLAGEQVFHCYFPSNRSLKALVINTWLAIRIFLKERPDLVVSTGAAPAVPFIWLGRLLGIRIMFIEIFDRFDSGTATGKLVYPVTDCFVVQWESMKKVYPKAVCFGSIF